MYEKYRVFLLLYFKSTCYLDLYGLLSPEAPGQSLPAQEDGEHVGVPLLPVQLAGGVEQAGLGEDKPLPGLLRGDEVLSASLPLTHQVGQVTHQSS